MPQNQDIVLPQSALALYDNHAESNDELSFNCGDVLTVLEFDYSGYLGWWLCSFKGNQGICPGNRLRLLTEADLKSPNETMSKSWHQQVERARLESYCYDEPKPLAVGAAAGGPMQYDSVPSIHLPVDSGVAESYDVPRPAAPVSPSSSHGSLGSLESKPNTVQPYDVPRPLHPLVPPQEEEYDVPKEVVVDVGSGLDWLGRLEAEVEAGVRSVVGCSLRRPHTARTDHVRRSVLSLSTSVHRLLAFATTSLLNITQGSGMIGKLKALVEAVSAGQSRLERSVNELEASGLEEDRRHALDSVASSAANILEDITSLSSFMQGNATLIFRKAEVLEKTDKDTADYYNIDCEEKRDPVEDQLEPPAPVVLSPADLKTLKFLWSIMSAEVNSLGSAVTAFIQSVEHNQPPRAFLSQVKLILLAGHKVVSVADSAVTSLSCKQVILQVEQSADSLAMALQAAVKATRDAAAHFPNINTVQRMVNSVYTVADLARQTCAALTPLQ